MMNRKVCRSSYKRGRKTICDRDSEGRTRGNPLRRLVYALLLVLCI